MSNQDDSPLELDDNFDEYDFDQGFEDDFDDESFDTETLDSGVEEYSDDIESFDDETFDGDLADDEEWQDIEEPQPRNKSGKSFLSFNTIVIGGAVLLGGFVLYMQLNKTPANAPTVDRFTSALNMQGATDGPIFGKSEEENTSKDQTSDDSETLNQDEGFLFEPEVLDSMQIDLEGAPPQPSPIANIEDEVINIEDRVDQMMAESNEIGVPRAPQVQEDIEISVKPPAVVEPAPALEETVVVLDEVPAIEPVIEVKAPELEIKQDEKLSEIEEPVQGQATEEVEVTESDPVAGIQPPADLSAITDKLDMIVTRLDRIEGRIDNVQDTNEAAIQSMQRDIKKIQSKPAKTTVRKSQPKVAAKPKAATSSKRAPVQVSKAKSWELRAAQPGKAWVSERGASSMTAVQVGDSLDNIGRITAISFNNNRWTVIGTKGRISQ